MSRSACQLAAQQVLAFKSAEHVPTDLDLTGLAAQVAEAEAVVWELKKNS